MTERFSGSTGQRSVTDVLLEHRLVLGSHDVAARLAAAGALVTFDAGTDLITQGDFGNDVYFILAGEASVLVNGRSVSTRGHRDAVGEMAAIDPAVPRSATVRALGKVVALKVGIAEFEAVVDAHPKLWKPLAKIAAERLRERGRFHRPPNTSPVLFVGSSAEGLPIAREVQNQLNHDAVEVRLWTTGVFGAGGFPADSLLEQVARADFAVFVFGPDDTVGSREVIKVAPRDNVIFEMGLFMGRIGRSRVLMLKERQSDLKIPSDLLGVTPLTYVRREGTDLSTSLGPPCNELRTIILKEGVV